MSIIPLDCPACGANLSIDSSLDNWICNYCGKPFVVKDAIVNYYIKNDVKIKLHILDSFQVETKMIMSGENMLFNTINEIK